MTPREQTRAVRALVEGPAADLGVRHLGFCPLGDLSGLLRSRRQGVARQLAEAGGSAMVVLLPYYAGDFPERNVARYALGQDYHRVAMEILSKITAPLRAACDGRVFLPLVDSSPLPEVELAVRAGLGFRGRHGQLIAPGLGSMAFVCEVMTDLPLEPDLPVLENGCGGCRRCLAACPTGALTEEGVNTALCRSHITQKKGELTPWEARQVALGGFAWGCDLCTDACPYNRGPEPTPIGPFREDLTPVLTRENLDGLLPGKSYAWRGRDVLLRNLTIIGEERDRVGDTASGTISGI